VNRTLLRTVRAVWKMPRAFSPRSFTYAILSAFIIGYSIGIFILGETNSSLILMLEAVVLFIISEVYIKRIKYEKKIEAIIKKRFRVVETGRRWIIQELLNIVKR